MTTNNVNRAKIDFGYDAQLIQCNKYNFHVKTIANIQTRPSMMCNKANDNRHYDTMKRNRVIANIYRQERYDKNLKKENLQQLGNIHEVDSNNYKSAVIRRKTALDAHKFKSIRGDEMRNFNKKIRQENTSMSARILKTKSNYPKDQIVASSLKTLSHGAHLTKFAKNRRHYENLPKIFETKGFSSTRDKSDFSQTRSRIFSQVSSRSKTGAFSKMDTDDAKTNFNITSRTGLNTSWKIDKISNVTAVKGTHLDMVMQKEDVFLNDEDKEFYEKGSVILSLNHLMGHFTKEKNFKIVVSSENGQELVQYEFLLEIAKNFKYSLNKDKLVDVAGVKIEIYLMNENNVPETKLGEFTCPLKGEEKESDDNNKDLFKSEFNNDSVKYGFTVILV